MRLENKVALVTGTSPNIGGGIAEELGKEGASVVCVDMQPENAAACARAIQSAGGKAVGVACDVTVEDQVKAAVDKARAEYGGLDVLVSCAAIFNQKGVLDMPVDEWRRQIDIILTGNFLFTKYAAQLMVEQRRPGSVICISSTAGHQGQARNIGYSTSKAGILNFVRSAAAELGQYGIRVNSISPTGTDSSESAERSVRWGVTPRQAGPPNEQMLNLLPLHKQPRPWHYARAAVFLASDDAEMITGEDLRVDSGSVSRHWTWGLTLPSGPLGFQAQRP